LRETEPVNASSAARRAALVRGAAGIVFGSFSIARAQPSDPLAADPLFELDPFAVDAFRLPFSVDEFPGSAQVLTADDLQALGWQSLAEALEASANLTFQSYSGNSATATIDLRGYGENGSLRTLILVDGQPLNRADMGSSSWLEIPLGRVERVEILRGPQTARFGNFAVGGVINIVTRLDPTDAPRTQLDGGGGRYNEWWLRLHHSRPLGGGALAISAEHTATDGYRVNGGYEAASIGLSHAQTFAAGPTLRIGGFYLEDRTEFPGALSGGPNGEFPLDPRASQYGPYANQYFSDNRKGSLTGALAWPEGSAGGQIKLRSGVNWRELQWNFGPGSHADNTQLEGRFSLEYQRPVGEKTTLRGGLATQGTQLDFDSFRTIERKEILSHAELEQTSAAAYLQGEVHLSESWALTLATRHEHHRLTGENTDYRSPSLNFAETATHDGSSAQLGLQWRPRPGWRAWARYDRLYRFPVTDEVAAYQRYGLSAPFNHELEPEKGHNGEVGAEWSGNFGTVGLNFFAQNMSGEIAYDFEQNLNTNLTDTRRIGVELNVRTVVAGWILSARHTWLDVTLRNGDHRGNDVPLVSPHAFSASLATPEWLHTQLTLEGVYRHGAWEGGDFANEQPLLPSWMVFHLALHSRLTPTLSAYFRLNNFFDRDYATLKFLGSWYPAPGRHLRAGLRWDF